MTIQPGAPTEHQLAGMACDEVRGFLVEVTPPLARAWLHVNTGNRAIRRTVVQRYARSIEQQRWKITHQGIAFSKTGRLLDGQHRLHAVVQSGKPVFMTVYVGLDDDVFGAIDAGSPRVINDWLQQDKRVIEPATFIAKVLIAGWAPPTLDQVVVAMGCFGADIKRNVEVAGTKRPGKTTAAIRAAWALRHAAANDAQKKLLCDQWTAFVEFEPDRMDRTTVSLTKRLENIRETISTVVAAERLCVAWLGFNPVARDLHKIIIKNQEDTLDEVRQFVRTRVETSQRRHLPDRQPARVADSASSRGTGFPAW